jgi:hypothetical protein
LRHVQTTLLQPIPCVKMGPRRASRRPPKVAHPTVLLGAPERDELELSDLPQPPTPRASTPHASTPDSTPSEDEDIPGVADKKKIQVRWSTEMEEALLEYINQVWLEDYGKSSTAFKQDVYQAAAGKVNRVTTGSTAVRWAQCKNKWADYKEKWKHFTILGESSGFGWSDSKEKFEAFDYVWDNLNKAYPRIIWHKTHILDHRDILSKVLHESLATGRGALANTSTTPILIDDFPIDPRLLHDSIISSSNVSPAPLLKPKSAYNKSRKRARVEASDDEGEGTPVLAKKVDIGFAITSLSAELARGRKAREEHKSVQQKAIQLLETYGDRLDTLAFIQGCTFFGDEAMANIFTSITLEDRRDRWLEINLRVELKKID